MGLLGDVRAENGLWDRFAATPTPATSPEILLLGSSDFSAQLAGLLGLPFAFAHHFDMGGTLEAVDVYRHHFRASPVLDKPHTIVSATVHAAEDHDRAEFMAGPSILRRYGMRTGRLLPLLSPEHAAEHPEMSRARMMPTSSLTGTASEVVDALDALQRATGADELMLYPPTHGLPERLDTIRLIAAAW